MQTNQITITQFAKVVLAFSIACGAISGCAGPEENPQNQTSTSTGATSTSSATTNTTAPDSTASTATNATATSSTADTSTLMSRTVVNAPAFNHPAVSEASIQAVKNAIAALPAPLRAKLDQNGARVI